MSIKSRAKEAARLILRPGSPQFRVAKKLALATRLISGTPRDICYMEWVETTEPYMWSKSVPLKYKPKISIVVPVYNPPAKYFLPMVYSVVNQTYENWELVLVNASTSPKCRQQTEACNSIDTRIKVVNLVSNKGIAENTNAGIEQADGKYVALLDHDDLLAPAALYEMVSALQDNKSAGLVYSDEDKISEDGEERFDPHFKPDWSPQLLRELNYINHFTLIKKSLIDQVGGYRQGFEGAQDYDLFLRIVDRKPLILHVPKVLYHWRITETSTARDFSMKKNILKAGIRALEEHLERNNQSGIVSALRKQPGFYRINYYTKRNRPVALIVMPSPIVDQYKKLLETLVADLGSTKYGVEMYAQPPVEAIEHSPGKNLTVIYSKSGGRQELIKSALNQTEAEICVVIDAALVPKTPGWLGQLAAFIDQQQEVGLVSPLLTDASAEIVFDAGYVNRSGTPIPLFRGHKVGTHTYLGNSDWVRNLDALSGRCFAIRASSFREYLKVNETKFTIHDLCNYIKARDLQIVSWPFVNLLYKGELAPAQRETKYFNAALTLNKQEFSVGKTINMPQIEDK